MKKAKKVDKGGTVKHINHKEPLLKKHEETTILKSYCMPTGGAVVIEQAELWALYEGLKERCPIVMYSNTNICGKCEKCKERGC